MNQEQELSWEESLKNKRQQFEDYIDTRYGDMVGHFDYSTKTRHIADVFYEFCEQFISQNFIHKSKVEEVVEERKSWYSGNGNQPIRKALQDLKDKLLE